MHTYVYNTYMHTYVYNTYMHTCTYIHVSSYVATKAIQVFVTVCIIIFMIAVAIHAIRWPANDLLFMSSKSNSHGLLVM